MSPTGSVFGGRALTVVVDSVALLATPREATWAQIPLFAACIKPPSERHHTALRAGLA